MLFWIVRQITSLVNTNSANAQILGVTEGLVQRIGNNTIGDKILGHGAHWRHRIVFLGIRRVLAETFDSSAVVRGGRIPFHGPNRADKVVGCRLFLLNSQSQSTEGT